jgi:cyclophilin family peptidyl-prolyl cis-trans isomerase/HEAT repeat protein
MRPRIALAFLLILPSGTALAAPSLRALARAADPASFPLLRAALSGDDPAARAEAAFALGRLGLVPEPEDPAQARAADETRAAATDALAAAAADPDPAVRRAAVTALGRLSGAAGAPALLAAATDADAGVRGAAALALYRQRERGRTLRWPTGAVERLTTLAADRDAGVRWRALLALSAWPPDDAAGVLEAAQTDADWRARMYAAQGLGRLKRAPDARLLSDPDLYVRAAAVKACAEAKAWDKIPDAAFTDPSHQVRAAAADAAASSGDRARFVPLLTVLAAGMGTVAPGRALIALARLDPAAAGTALETARRDPRWFVRARAYEAAALLPDSEAVLRRGIEDHDPRVASSALDSLALSTGPAVEAALRRALTDPDAPLELRGTAAETAAKDGSPALLDAVIAARRFAVGPGSDELRGDLRDALEKTARDHPEAAAKARAALKGFPLHERRAKSFWRVDKGGERVRVDTDKGSFVILLASRRDAGTRITAFLRDVRKGRYDGRLWHRAVPGFVVQGGDPRGSGWGDDGWRLRDEFNPIPFRRGTVGTPTAGPDTAGCQLFITLTPAPRLDGRYAAFGRVVSGMEAVDRLEPGDRILKMTVL